MKRIERIYEGLSYMSSHQTLPGMSIENILGLERLIKLFGYLCRRSGKF